MTSNVVRDTTHYCKKATNRTANGEGYALTCIAVSLIRRKQEPYPSAVASCYTTQSLAW